MNSDWPTRSLEECLDALIDYRGKTPTKTSAGIPLVTAKVIKGGRIETPTEFISADEYETWMRRGIPQPGDVVLTTEAPLGEVAQLGGNKIALAQRVITLRGRAGVLDSTYLLYLLQSEEMQSQLKSRATGTTVLGIKQSELRKISVRLPPIEQQSEVAAVLSALDKRIDLIRATNMTLEAVAQALFKSWFVDFDPVRAKAEGREPVGLDAETAGLFPDQFETSEQGLVPKGWKYESLKSALRIFDSQRVPLSGQEREKRKGPYPYYGAATLMDYVDDYIFDGVYLLMGEDGSVADQNGYPITQYVWGKIWVNNHAHVLQGKDGISTEHLLLSLKRTNIQPYITGAVQAKISQANMWRIPFLMPPKAIAEAFGNLLEPLFAAIRSNTENAQILTELRDTLLPRLISGQLRLPDAEALLQDAA